MNGPLDINKKIINARKRIMALPHHQSICQPIHLQMTYIFFDNKSYWSHILKNILLASILRCLIKGYTLLFNFRNFDSLPALIRAYPLIEFQKSVHLPRLLGLPVYWIFKISCLSCAFFFIISPPLDGLVTFTAKKPILFTPCSSKS